MNHEVFLICAATIFGYTASFIAGLVTFVYDLLTVLFDSVRRVKSIRGELAVITGGAGGLGSAICHELAEKGCHIAVIDVNSIGARAVADRLGREHANIKVQAYAVDITQREAVMVLRADIERDFQKTPTILINNAGILIHKDLFKPEPEEVQRMIDVNLTSHFWMIEAFLPAMKEGKHGHIVAISSLAGKIPLPKFDVYSSTKFGVRALMQCLRLSLKMDDQYKLIRTTIIYPFFMNTNKNVLSVFENCGGSSVLSAIKSESAARQIVQALRRNKEEVSLPSVFMPLTRLCEMAPLPIVDWILALIYRAAFDKERLHLTTELTPPISSNSLN